MKLALEAMERYQVKRQDFDRFADEITALQKALAEQPAQQGCMRCNTPKKCALYGCSPLTWPSEKPAQQEPVAWMVDVDLANYQGQSEYRTILAWNAKPVWSGTHEINEVLKAVPLYTSPPAQRPWVGLTLERKMDMAESYFTDEWAINRAIQLLSGCENALKEKNT